MVFAWAALGICSSWFFAPESVRTTISAPISLSSALSSTKLIDVISPCVTFNDHEGSTKSYAYVKDHDEPLGEISFIPFFDDISVDYEPGTVTEVRMHDGSQLYLRKIADDYNPTDKIAALRVLHETLRRGEFATGILYIEPDKEDFREVSNLVDGPLARLPEARVRPPKAVLDELMDQLR